MAVVTAAVHTAIIERAESFAVRAVVGVCRFRQIVRVDIEPQTDRLSFFVSAQDGAQSRVTAVHLLHQMWADAAQEGAFSRGGEYVTIRQSETLIGGQDISAQEDFPTELGQYLGDRCSRDIFCPTDFCVAVKKSSPCRQFFGERGSFCDDGIQVRILLSVTKDYGYLVLLSPSFSCRMCARD